MAEKISAKVQNILKWLVPLLLIFAIFFALNEKKQEQIVVLPEDHTETEIVDELKERGYLSNSISYFIAKIAHSLKWNCQGYAPPSCSTARSSSAVMPGSDMAWPAMPTNRSWADGQLAANLAAVSGGQTIS